MPVQAPWSVKGIDPETREAAKIAARRAGLPLGAWLTQVIRSAAVTQFKGPTESEPAPTTERAPGSSVPAPTMMALLDGLQKLAQRIDKAEKTTTEVVAPLAERIDELSTSVEEVKVRNAAAATAPVERAVSRISERLDRIEAQANGRGRRRLFGLLR